MDHGMQTFRSRKQFSSRQHREKNCSRDDVLSNQRRIITRILPNNQQAEHEALDAVRATQWAGLHSIPLYLKRRSSNRCSSQPAAWMLSSRWPSSTSA